MIISGRVRGDGRSCGRYLLSDPDAVVLRINGSDRTDIREALDDFELMAMGTRCAKPLYHSSLNPHPDDIASGRWVEAEMLDAAVGELAGRMGLVGHPYVLVRHGNDKAGKTERTHYHVVWLRLHPETGRVAAQGWNFAKQEEAARELEDRFGLRPEHGRFGRRKLSRREDGARANLAGEPQIPLGGRQRVRKSDRQRATEARKTPRHRVTAEEVAQVLAQAWREAAVKRDPAVFVRHCERRGLFVARGDKGKGPIVAVDGMGVPHGVARRLGLRRAEVEKVLGARRLASMDAAKQRAREYRLMLQQELDRTNAENAALQIRLRDATASFRMMEAENARLRKEIAEKSALIKRLQSLLRKLIRAAAECVASLAALAGLEAVPKILRRLVASPKPPERQIARTMKVPPSPKRSTSAALKAAERSAARTMEDPLSPERRALAALGVSADRPDPTPEQEARTEAMLQEHTKNFVMTVSPPRRSRTRSERS
jgi:hypothetical protein